MRFVFALALCLAAGCRLATPAFHCDSDSVCQLSTSAGRCIDGACAEPTSARVCASGFVFDRSAGERANECVAVVAADLGEAHADLAPRADLATTRDLATDDLAMTTDLATTDLAHPVAADLATGADLACVPDAVCVPPSPAGLTAVGACAGTLTCTPTPSCNAAFSATAQTTAAPNGSFDWNCDGSITPQTPRPSNLTLGAAPTDADAYCRAFYTNNDIAGCCDGATTAGCNGDHWFAAQDPASAASCGETITHINCFWGANGNNFGCRLNTSSTVTQACF